MRDHVPEKQMISWHTGNVIGVSRQQLSLKDIIFSIFSIETFFGLCLYAGRIKGDLEEYNLPDLTIVFACLTAFAVLVYLARGGKIDTSSINLAFWGLFLFACAATIGLLWTVGKQYGFNKVILIWVFCFCSFALTCLVIGPDPQRFRRFCNVLIILGAVNILQSWKALANGFGGFQNDFGGDYITFAYSLYTMSIILTLRCVYDKVKPVTLALNVALAILGVLLGLASGARTASVAFFVVVFIAVWLALLQGFFGTSSRKITKRFSMAVPVFIAALLIAPLLVDFENFAVFERLRTFWEFQGGGNSAEVRTVFYAKALEMWEDCPISGCGSGSFPIYAGFGDMRAYPHNLFMEILAEFGSVGMCFFLLALIPAFWRLLKNGFSNSFAAQASVIMLFTFVSAMSSSDISDNRMIFVGMGLLFAALRPHYLDQSRRPAQRSGGQSFSSGLQQGHPSMRPLR